MSDFTDLDIIDAIRLVKAGNDNVEYMIIPHLEWFPVLKAFYLHASYRISSDKLAEWNYNNKLKSQFKKTLKDYKL